MVSFFCIVASKTVVLLEFICIPGVLCTEVHGNGVISGGDPGHTGWRFPVELGEGIGTLHQVLVLYSTPPH